MRFQTKKASARATALALILGVTAVLVTALPASASTITSSSPTSDQMGTNLTISGTNLTVTKHHPSAKLNLCLHGLDTLGKRCGYGNQFWGPFLTASGTVRVTDGFNACRSHVTVRIQRLKNGSWKTAHGATGQTSGKGKYVVNLGPDRTGKYRVIANKKVLNGGDDICVAYRSAPVGHHHTF